MTLPSILMTTPMLASVVEALDAEFSLTRLWEQQDQKRFFAEQGTRFQGIATSIHYSPLGEDMIARLPNLEIISNFGVGYDNVDAHAAAAHNVVVTNTPHVLDEEVADLTLGLTLATVRQLPQADRYVREGRWSAAAFPFSPTLRGRRIGILGLGNIGKAIARRFEGFSVPIGYHGRKAQDDVAYPYFATPVELAEWADILIVVVPGGDNTRHMVNADVLKALGSQGILINVARGSVVDQPALIDALASGAILSAGLDVFEGEPHVPAELIAMPNLVLLPHVGSASIHTRGAMGDLVVDNLRSWFAQGRAITPVPETAHLAVREGVLR